MGQMKGGLRATGVSGRFPFRTRDWGEEGESIESEVAVTLSCMSHGSDSS